jgi:hypothetical protein
MAMLDHIAHVLLALLTTLGALVLSALATLEAALGQIMTSAHIPPDVQTILGLLLAIAFLIAALQLFGGFIRVVLIVLLLAIVVHAAAFHGLAPPVATHAEHG